MSSLATYPNHATATASPISEFDNDDDSSFIRQNESMMHKVKDVVSKLLHPSFLFSSNNDTNSPKRKRSTSAEENGDEQPSNIDTTITSTRTTAISKYRRSGIKNDEPQLTDEEDDTNSRDVPISSEEDPLEIEQQKKRRRTANYHNLLSTRTMDDQREDERTSSTSTFKNGVRSLSNRRTDYTTPFLLQTSMEPNHRDRTSRLTPSQQLLNVLPTYRASAANYDPSKSPLFAVRSQKPTETTASFKPNDFSANHLLASGLINRPHQSSPYTSQQSPATLTNPTTNTNNRLLSNERQMLGVNYASINSRRLPYIERLRRRTLQDGVRPSRTPDNEPLSTSVVEERQSTPDSSMSKRTKPLEKDCGIQCDIPLVENSPEASKKSKRSFPPPNIQDEALSVPQTYNPIEPPIQTNSSITIEKPQPPISVIDISRPKVLGDVTPFSWPKFARAQDDFATKYPEKCRLNPASAKPPAAAPTIEKSNVNLAPPVFQQTNTSTIAIPKIPVAQSSSSRPAESIWKCPCCTKEHPAQTASCSVCHGINPNYKKPSAVQTTVTVEREAAPSIRSSDVITKETNASTLRTNVTKAATTKENTTFIPSVANTNTSNTTFPSFSFTPATSLSATAKETPVITTNTPTNTTTSTTSVSSIPSVVSLTSTPAETTKENLVTTGFNIPHILSFGPATTVTDGNTVTTPAAAGFNNPPILAFGIAPATTTATYQNPVSASAPLPVLSTAPFTKPTSETKESPVTTSAPPSSSVGPFSSMTTPPDTSSATTANTPFRIGTPFLTFPSTSRTTLTPAITTSTVPSITTMTPAVPVATSIPFGSFGSTPIVTTSVASPALVPSGAFNPSVLFGFQPTSSTSFLPTRTTTPSNPFSVPIITPVSPIFTSPVSFPVSSTTNTFSSFNNASFSSTAPAPNTGGFGSLNSSITTAPSSVPTFGASPLTFPAPFSLGASPSTNSNPSSLFGASSTFGTNATPNGTSSASSSSFLPSDSSNASSGFPFGHAPNTIGSQASTASPGGFQFAAPTPVTAGFGSGPSPFASSGSTNTFSTGVGLSPLMSAHPFPTDGFGNPTFDPLNPYSVPSGTTPRHILRPKRRTRN